MRAVYTPSPEFNTIDNGHELSGATAHHLIKVLRVKASEKLLLLNGEGEAKLVEISEVQKKSLKINVLEVKNAKKKSHITMAIGQLKKDAMDSALKSCVELGVDKIIITRSEFSQRYELNTERVNRLLVSALEQSNNYFLPIVENCDLKSIKVDEYQNKFVCSLKTNIKGNELRDGKSLIFIGPEGGFSCEEEVYLESKDCHFLSWDLPILRAKTACVFSVGYIMGMQIS